jgi:hypothetical protein
LYQSAVPPSTRKRGTAPVKAGITVSASAVRCTRDTPGRSRSLLRAVVISALPRADPIPQTKKVGTRLRIGYHPCVRERRDRGGIGQNRARFSTPARASNNRQDITIGSIRIRAIWAVF